MCLNRTYNKTISVSSHDRKERDEIMLSMQLQHDRMMSTLNNFNGVSNDPINYKDLIDFPLLEWKVLNDKVKIRRRNMLFGDYINFDTEIKGGGEFGKHFHLDVIESCEIIKGSMLDLYDNKVYHKNEVMHYEKGEVHKPIALEDSVLKVIFKP